MYDTGYKRKKAANLPRIGQRIIKTAVAVFICLIIYYLIGYGERDLPMESCITAIICMQPYVQGTRVFALNRVTGTFIGAFWGILFLLVMAAFPSLGNILPLAYLLMGFGVLMSVYSSVLVKKTDAAVLCAIVFVYVALSFRETDSLFLPALGKIIGVLIGTAVAILVNIFHLPRQKDENAVFFLRTRDIVPDRFSQIPAPALFRLNYLYNEGAKICLISQHAPAFFNLQMSATKLNVPLIVMDGAALYDASENVYLSFETVPPEATARFRQLMESNGLGYFIYTIHKDKTCIFRRGEMTPQERAVYDRMKRSPYRSYLDGDICDPREIVYFKLIASDSAAEALSRELSAFAEENGLRAVLRPQPGFPGASGLYFYSAEADVQKAEARLMEMLREQEGNEALRPVEVFSGTGYRSEEEAIQLTHRLENLYAPIRLFGRKK